MALSEGRDAEGNETAGVGSFLFSLLVVPIVALVTALAVAVSRRSGGRALLLAGLALLFAIGTGTCRAGMVDMNASPAGALVWSLISYGSLAVITAGAALALLALTPRAIREELDRDRRDYMGARLADAGSVALLDLEQELRLPAAELREQLVELVAAGSALRVEHAAGRVYAAAHVVDRQQRIATTLRERGRLEIPALAGELGEPRSVVESWIAELLRGGRVVGTIDRERQLFLWDPMGDGAIGARAFEQRDCEKCGGPLRALGHGLFRCVYCGTDVEAAEAPA